ncbi:repressor LexA [Candidatus Methylomirabilis limnetica]|jgi:repressor LexA|uniref:LexA repressor n=1 Tax=Candidatus Methylomirabilis limnetica TaxID=2033718 RepID=A0A2T4TXC4_9BACT|nr:transcriptional repressor LexA [Candidatus Methylomirabilis limnetica]PTL35773.1 repressor LexA [Candidatus Methylomirabilis limnetica]
MVLTDRQRQILTFIATYKARHGAPPTQREIAQHLKIYIRGVQYHLERMEKAGHLTRTPKRARAIELRQEQRTTLTPLLGRVAAGRPVLAEEHIEATYPLPQEWTGSGKTFLLKVHGDSMRDARIFDGDLVLVAAQPEAHPGEIVVAMVENEATVKRFQTDGTTVVLMPENEAFAPIRITQEQRFQILGKVIGVYRKL